MLQCADARFYCNTAAASFGTKLETDVLSLQRDDTSALVFMKEGCLDKEEDGTGVALFVAGFVVIRLNHFLSPQSSPSPPLSRFSIHVFAFFSFLSLLCLAS